MGFDFLKASSDLAAGKIPKSVSMASDSFPVEIAPAKSEIDLEYAKALIMEFDAKIEQIEREAAAFEVTDDATAREATERAGEVAGFIARLEGKRKDIISDADSFVRKTNQFVKPRRDRLDGAGRLYRQRIADYQHRLELERRAVIRRQEEERIKMQAALDAEAERLNVEKVVVAAPVAVPRTAGPVRAESATSSTVMVLDFEVVDAARVPRPYLAVDPAAIRAAIKGGIREIDGVKIFERAEIRVRRVG